MKKSANKENVNISRGEFLPSITLSGDAATQKNINRKNTLGTPLQDTESTPESRSVLVEQKAINVGLGISLIGGATFLHHAEEVARVPYRSQKDFPGHVTDKNGKLLDNVYSTYARKPLKSGWFENEWHHVWDDFGAIFGVILASFWRHFGIMMG